MAVPAHDQEIFEFAKKFDLPIRVVIASEESNLMRGNWRKLILAPVNWLIRESGMG